MYFVRFSDYEDTDSAYIFESFQDLKEKMFSIISFLEKSWGTGEEVWETDLSNSFCTFKENIQKSKHYDELTNLFYIFFNGQCGEFARFKFSQFNFGEDIKLI